MYTEKQHKEILECIKEKIKEKPIFLMMVGIPGSGKSSVALKIKEELDQIEKINIVSSDNLREELLGDINDQSQNEKIFGEMKRRTINSLKENCSVIYDATNLCIKDRKGILNLIKEQKINCFNFAYIIPTSLTLCLVNGVKRNRVVPFEVMTRMLQKFQIPIYQEGFNNIFIEGYSKTMFMEEYFCEKVPEKLIVPMKYRHYTLLEMMENFEQGTHYHKFSLLEHSMLAYEEVLRHTRKFGEKNNPLEKAGLLHDIGKLQTKIKNDKGEFSYYGHANVGAYNLLQNLDWLGLSCIEQALYCVALINYHMEPFNWEIAKTSTVEKKKKFFGEIMYNDLMILHKADIYASTGEREK